MQKYLWIIMLVLGSCANKTQVGPRKVPDQRPPAELLEKVKKQECKCKKSNQCKSC